MPIPVVSLENGVNIIVATNEASRRASKATE